MNVYDFDNTIYDGDSTVEFWFFVMKKYPRIIHLVLYQIWGAFQYKMGSITKKQFKEKFYCFLSEIECTEQLIDEFWDKKESKIKNWYFKVQEKDDVIVSASPEFLLYPICKRIGVYNLIASKVDVRSGKYSGENCYGKEKVKRLIERFPNEEIGVFYSDSSSDLPLAEIAEKSFLIKGQRIIEWKIKKGISE